MKRDINLNSNAWCDLVFEGKNKEYGAYNMRQTASQRHVMAFGVMITAVFILAFAPSLLEEVGIGRSGITGVTEATVITNIQLNEPPVKEDIATLPLPAPPVELQKSLAFTPPTIVDNDTDTEGREMLSQDDLNKEKDFIISSVTVVEGTKTGIDAATLLGKIPASTGTGDGGGAPELVPDVPAKYLGGDSELMLFLNKNIRYPHIAVVNIIEGRSVVRFVVSIDGSISDVKIIKSSDPLLDKEAIRVVKSMPKWVPGKKNGRNVNAYFTLPVIFKLSR